MPVHEVCAEVVELGDGVDYLAVGDRVTLHGFVYCGTCTACREGRYYQCDNLNEVGFTVDGGYREYASLPSYTLTPIPREISDAEATRIDSAAYTLHAMRRVGTEVTDTAAVLGTESLGLYGVQFLQARGGRRRDFNRDPRRAASGRDRSGCEPHRERPRGGPAAAIDDYTDGEGVDICVEAAGAGEVVDTCLQITKNVRVV